MTYLILVENPLSDLSPWIVAARLSAWCRISALAMGAGRLGLAPADLLAIRAETTTEERRAILQRAMEAQP